MLGYEVTVEVHRQGVHKHVERIQLPRHLLQAIQGNFPAASWTITVVFQMQGTTSCNDSLQSLAYFNHLWYIVKHLQLLKCHCNRHEVACRNAAWQRVCRHQQRRQPDACSG